MNKKEFYKQHQWLTDMGLNIDNIWQWIEEYAIEMCKRQRENCADEYHYNSTIKELDSMIYNKINDAPLPKEY